ncbi:hypothetical protein M758_2G039100 [Ceratodon purpureus]|nr:hypothetical protein M758_2G039100 [Ceratodon purpureus]
MRPEGVQFNILWSLRILVFIDLMCAATCQHRMRSSGTALICF